MLTGDSSDHIWHDVDSCLETGTTGHCYQCFMSKKHTSDLSSRFGSVLTTKRLELGWTQDKLAEKAGLDRSFISGIERDTRSVSIITLEKLADALGMPTKGLFKDL